MVFFSEKYQKSIKNTKSKNTYPSLINYPIIPTLGERLKLHMNIMKQYEIEREQELATIQALCYDPNYGMAVKFHAILKDILILYICYVM